jgi:hypothetical protein
MLALALALTLGAAPVEVEIHYMPPGTALILQTGEQVRYFKFEEYKLLLKLDGDLWELNQRLELYKDIDLKYTGILKAKDTVIQSLLDDKKIREDRLMRVEENWHAAEKRAIDNAGGPVWPYILAAGGAVVGIVGATLFAVSLAKR